MRRHLLGCPLSQLGNCPNDSFVRVTIQNFAKPGLSDAKLRDYLRQSHAIVAQGLSRKRRIELGLETRYPPYSASRIVR